MGITDNLDCLISAISESSLFAFIIPSDTGTLKAFKGFCDFIRRGFLCGYGYDRKSGFPWSYRFGYASV